MENLSPSVSLHLSQLFSHSTLTLTLALTLTPTLSLTHSHGTTSLVTNETLAPLTPLCVASRS